MNKIKTYLQKHKYPIILLVLLAPSIILGFSNGATDLIVQSVKSITAADTLNDFALFAFTLNAFYMVVGLVIIWRVLRFADKRAGFEFKKIMARENERCQKEGLTIATAIYLAGRLVAASIFFSAFIA